MKRLISFLLVIICTFAIIGCTSKEKENIESVMIYPDGLPAIAMSKFIDSSKIENLNIKYEKQDTPDALLAELIKGESDFAIVPSNLALKVAEKKLDYKVAGTIGWGSFYLISTEDINSLDEIKSYEVYNTGKGLTPDIVTKKILEEKGIDESNINFNYVSAASELAPLIISGKVKVAVVPEPVLSTIKVKNKNIKILLDLNKEWANTYKVDKGYPQSTLLIKSDLYNKLSNDGRLEILIEQLTDNIKWVNENTGEVAVICDKLGIKVNKEVLPEAIKNSNLSFSVLEDCRKEYEKYFDAIGGKSEDYNKLFN